jgi:hypothetical protein
VAEEAEKQVRWAARRRVLRRFLRSFHGVLRPEGEIAIVIE